MVIMQRFLIVLGILILLAGLLWPVLIKLPFGKLPGDIIIDKPNFKIYIPITTMLLISIFLSIIFWIFKK
ncbi:MAG: DUF2905 domain-containing protein [Ignavibacterium sp.]|nr:MAG: DUF2905 domain-containing protein [Ignavibacterium sp.]